MVLIRRDEMRKKARVSMQRVVEAEEGSEGFCTNCQEWTSESCEPDAAEYECPLCGQQTVYGAEEALLLGLFVVEDK